MYLQTVLRNTIDNNVNDRVSTHFKSQKYRNIGIFFQKYRENILGINFTKNIGHL